MKRKCLVIGIILLFVGVTISPAIAQDTGKSQSVSRGNWLYVGGSGPGNYTRIQDAIDDASDGDTIFVYDDSAPYNENLLINKTIHLIGEKKESTVINGDSKVNVIRIFAVDVRITGFSILMTGNEEGNAGIFVNSNNSLISENIILNNDWGIIVYDASFSTISQNIFMNNDHGLYLSTTKNIITENQFFNDGMYITTSGNIVENNTVNNKPLLCMENKDNTIIDDEYGQILLINCSAITVKNQNITKTDTGILLCGCYNCSIIQNNISNSRGGILLMRSNYNTISYNDLYQNDNYGISLSGSDYNLLEHNICTEQLLGKYLHHGIYLAASHNNTIRYSYLQNNHIGISCDYSNDNLIFENTIEYNTYVGVILETSCKGNCIQGNIIRGNDRGIVLKEAQDNEILQNDFYDNRIDMIIETIQYYTFRLRHLPHISENFWGRARIFPCLIRGTLIFVINDFPWNSIILKWVYVDWQPAQEPYNITRMP